MAKQISPVVKLRGSIDDLSFYRTNDGFMAREKRGIDPQRLKTDPAFRLTRLRMAEFAAAGQAGKLFRDALVKEIAKASASRMAGRVVTTMLKVIKSDTVHNLGERNVQSGNISQLEGFQFNPLVGLSTVVKVPVSATVDRTAAQAQVIISELAPKTEIVRPANATHYRFFAAGAAIDFALNSSEVQRKVSTDLPLEADTAPALTLQMPLTLTNDQPVFVVLGIEFLCKVNNTMEPLAKGLNSLQVIKVDTIV